MGLQLISQSSTTLQLRMRIAPLSTGYFADVGGTITEAANLDPLSMYQRAKRRRNASKDDSTKKRTGEEVNNMLNAAGTMGDVRTSTARRPTEQVLNAIKSSI